MLWQSVTAWHYTQGLAVAAATQIVESNDHSVEITLITAVGGFASVVAANLTANYVKQRRGDGDEVTAQNRKLKRENAKLRRENVELRKASDGSSEG